MATKLFVIAQTAVAELHDRFTEARSRGQESGLTTLEVAVISVGLVAVAGILAGLLTPAVRRRLSGI